MKSFEVLRDTIQPLGAKAVASDLGVSRSLVYKWCQEREGVDAAGAMNPLDRLWKICELTENIEPVLWLCEQAGGYYMRNPEQMEPTQDVLFGAQKMFAEFSRLLEAVTQSYHDDRMIDEEEAAKIRGEWERLKRVGETFVAACEHGIYAEASDEPSDDVEA